MNQLGLEREIVDRDARDRTLASFRERGIVLPTFTQLADPATIGAPALEALAGVDPDAPEPLNLLRVHWYNDADRKRQVPVPGHVVLPRELTGVSSPIIVAFGNRFPMIGAHKVLAAYGCLVPRLVTGQFDPTHHRAIWPSTGNYCRGGVAISRILGCRSAAILPEGMSAERFHWLEQWVSSRATSSVPSAPRATSRRSTTSAPSWEPTRRTSSSISSASSEITWRTTAARGRPLERVYQAARETRPSLRMAGFFSASGSAGTLGAGDYLKERHGARIVAVEALECPTMLYNGFGEHNIQGIGDKHIPLIHNVTNTDIVAAVSDRSTDSLNVVFNTEVGRDYLRDAQGLSPELICALAGLGLSSICNVLSAVKTAKLLDLGPDDALLTVATDGANMYRTEVDKAVAKLFSGSFDRAAAERAFEEHMLGASTEHVMELSPVDRNRIFNLGYYTWVEQQGVSLDEFERRRGQDFWLGLRELMPVWDGLIEDFNREAGTAPSR